MIEIQFNTAMLFIALWLLATRKCLNISYRSILYSNVTIYILNSVCYVYH